MYSRLAWVSPAVQPLPTASFSLLPPTSRAARLAWVSQVTQAGVAEQFKELLSKGRAPELRPIPSLEDMVGGEGEHALTELAKGEAEQAAEFDTLAAGLYTTRRAAAAGASSFIQKSNAVTVLPQPQQP